MLFEMDVVNIFNKINEIGWGVVIIAAILLLSLTISAKELVKKALSTLGLRTNASIEKEQMLNRLDDMQSEIETNRKLFDDYKSDSTKQQEEWHKQSIDIRDNLQENQNGLREDIQSLTNMFKDFTKKEDENTVAMFRSSLWRLHKDFTTQGFITPDGLKTFMEMGKVYERAGGDDIYHEKLLPEVESLEIHYPDGSIYNQNN